MPLISTFDFKVILKDKDITSRKNVFARLFSEHLKIYSRIVRNEFQISIGNSKKANVCTRQKDTSQISAAFCTRKVDQNKKKNIKQSVYQIKY